MKLNCLAIALSIGFVGAFESIVTVNAQDTPTTKFVCGSWRDTPATVAQTPRGNVLVILWATDWVKSSADEPSLNPQSRCETISKNFQQAYDEGTLQYITTGFENGQNTICVAESYKGGCARHLFTLKPGSDPRESLNQIIRISNNEASGGDDPLTQSSGSRVYVDFEDFLNKAPRFTN